MICNYHYFLFTVILLDFTVYQNTNRGKHLFLVPADDDDKEEEKEDEFIEQEGVLED